MTVDERTRKIARNQAMYREANERIQDLNEAFGTFSGEFLVVCECPEQLCTQQIPVSPKAYEGIRADPAQFIVRPGHQAIDVEEIVRTEATYVVVRKHEGEPARLAEKTDPRH